MLEAIGESLPIIFSPGTLLMMLLGVVLGLVVGILPGMGGTVGMALLLPFVFGMDPYAAIALLIGMKAVTNTSDTFPAVLLGVPGSAGPQATIMDGYPMARRGEAGRALGASFVASMLGGLLGAAFLLLAIPVARPLVLALGTPELFMLTLVGVAMVAVLSRGAALAGVLAGAIGMLLGTVGAGPGAPTYRFSFDIVYFYDGISVAVMALGFFAIPEIVDLLGRRSQISSGASVSGRWDGARDAFRNKRLIVQSSLIGSSTGVVPGFGGGAADWIAYGVAKKTSKDERFGKGDVRGVIAPEATNNAKDGADLIPTLMFGIPGGGSMAIFLVGLMTLGVQVGPSMVDPDRNLSFTLVIIWTLCLANVVGTLLCFGASPAMARLANLPATKFMPFLIVIVFAAAYQSSRHWGDIILLLVFGVIGWVMKHLGFPRIPMLIGFILAVPAERYLTIANARYGTEWMTRPGVLILGLVVALFVGGAIVTARQDRVKRRLTGVATQTLESDGLTRIGRSHLVFDAVVVAMGLFAVSTAAGFPGVGRFFPLSIAILMTVLAAIQLVVHLFAYRAARRQPAGAEASGDDEIPTAGRLLVVVGWLSLYVALIALIGMLPASLAFVFLALRREARLHVAWAALGASLMTALLYALTHIMGVRSPPSLFDLWIF